MSSKPDNAATHTEDAPSFTRWALRALDCEVEPLGGNVWRARLPENLRPQWNGRPSLRFCAAANGNPPPAAAAENAAEDELLAVDPTSRLFRWTLEQLQAHGRFAHAMPATQPVSVHELAPKLFAHYDFPDGRIHLAGCRLDDEPILRLTVLSEENGAVDGLRHAYFARDGAPLAPELAERLHLGDVAALPTRPPPLDEDDVKKWIDTASAKLAAAPQGLIIATLIWCKFARGKLALGAGEHTVTVPFEGWTALLADGAIKPPAYHCPLSNLDTYHLAALDDGRIVAAEAIAKCAVSGKRVLASELETCAATGKQALGEYLQTCRVTGERVLASEMRNCSQCDQPVSPTALKGGRCAACRSLAAVRKDDPRMARLLDEYPQLDRWARWKMSETDDIYLLVAASWLRQLLLVVNKQSLEVTRIATSGRLFPNWVEMPSGQREELLG